MLSRRIEQLLWHPRTDRIAAAGRAVVATLRLCYAVLRDIGSGPLTMHAMGLVYVTLLSLVPLLAVSFAALKAFGFHRQMQPLLQQFLSPLGQRGAELTEHVIGFVDNAQGNLLAGLGVLLLFITAVAMAEKVEGSLNHIWRVERPRSLGRRISEYLSVIIVGPVVMVAAMTLIASLRSLTAIGIPPGTGGVDPGRTLAGVAPYLLVTSGFTLVNWFVPNTRVDLRAAMTGGLVGGVLWASTGAAFTTFVVNAATAISIYNTFAIAITALFWLYLCWLMLLIGAQVAFYVQNPDYQRIGYRQPVTGTGQQEQSALAIMLLAAMRFRDGHGPTSLAHITRATGLPGLALAPIVERLHAAGLLERTSHDKLLPGRTPEQILLQEILQAVRHPQRSDIQPQVHYPAALAAVSQRLEAALAGALDDASLASLIDGSAAPAGDPGAGPPA